MLLGLTAATLLLSSFDFDGVVGASRPVNDLLLLNSPGLDGLGAEPRMCAPQSQNKSLHHTGDIQGRLLVVVIGLECSGSKMTAKLAGKALGFTHVDSWSGHDYTSDVLHLSRSAPGKSAAAEEKYYRLVLHRSLPMCSGPCEVDRCFPDVPQMLHDFFRQPGNVPHERRAARVLVATRDRDVTLQCKQFSHQRNQRLAEREQVAGLNLMRKWMTTNFGFSRSNRSESSIVPPDWGHKSWEGVEGKVDFQFSFVSYEALVQLGEHYVQSAHSPFHDLPSSKESDEAAMRLVSVAMEHSLFQLFLLC